MVRTSHPVATRRRKKRLFKMAEGNIGGRRRLYRTVKETVRRALRYAYRDRRDRKGLFRRLWITRLGAAVMPFGITYSRFIDGLTKAKYPVNRKALSELAIQDPEAFANIVAIARNAAGV